MNMVGRNPVVTKLTLARELAAAGVDYSRRHGAACPWCGRKARITSSRPWDDATKIRYHRCDNGQCPLSTMNINIKSIEVDG